MSKDTTFELHSTEKSFEYENGFYLSASPRRFSKFIAHLELYKMALGVAGETVECGVFKGASFARWAKFRSLLAHESARKIIGFDTFGAFPEADYEQDNQKRDQFVASAGSSSISVEGLEAVLGWHDLCKNIELVQGDITKTVPEYVSKHPELRISLLNIDVDLYSPTKVSLEYFYPLVNSGGIVILDDYGVFPGATKAIEEYFSASSVEIKSFPCAATPAFVIKK